MKMFRITVLEVSDNSDGGSKLDILRFEQTVDEIDMHRLAVLVNPPPKRVYKRKEAKG